MRRLNRCCRKYVTASSRRLLQFKASKRETSFEGILSMNRSAPVPGRSNVHRAGRLVLDQPSFVPGTSLRPGTGALRTVQARFMGPFPLGAAPPPPISPGRLELASVRRATMPRIMTPLRDGVSNFSTASNLAGNGAGYIAALAGSEPPGASSSPRAVSGRCGRQRSRAMRSRRAGRSNRNGRWFGRRS